MEVWPQSWTRLTIIDNKTDCSLAQEQEECGPTAREEAVAAFQRDLPGYLPARISPSVLSHMVLGRLKPIKMEGNLLFQKTHSPHPTPLQKNLTKIQKSRDFPGGPMVKTPNSQCKEPGFNPWSRNWIPHAATNTWHGKINKLKKKKKRAGISDLMH